MGQVKTPQNLQFLPRFNWFFWEIHIPWIVVVLWLIFILLKKLSLTIFVSVLAFMEEPNFLPHSKSVSPLLICSCAQVFYLHLKNSMCRCLFFHLKYCLGSFLASYMCTSPYVTHFQNYIVTQGCFPLSFFNIFLLFLSSSPLNQMLTCMYMSFPQNIWIDIRIGNR